MSKIPGNENEVRIAVSGHRHLDFPDVIENSIQGVLREIMDRQPGAEYFLYSPLAAGADQIAARSALAMADFRLVVVLPMQIEEYLMLFTENEKKDFWKLYNKRFDQVVLPPQITHEMSFINLGQYLVGNCDYLITIWNGQSERGKGGTAQVVDLAKKADLKIAWIRANNIVNNIRHPISNDLLAGSVEWINC